MSAAVDGLSKGHRPLWKHTNRVYNILEYNYIVFPLTLILTFYGKMASVIFQRLQEMSD